MADTVGTPIDLDDSDLETAALKRTDADAANDDRPEPTAPAGIAGPDRDDFFERLDDVDYVDPDFPDQFVEPLELEFHIVADEDIDEEII